jgi:hypothetical protein
MAVEEPRRWRRPDTGAPTPAGVGNRAKDDDMKQAPYISKPANRPTRPWLTSALVAVTLLVAMPAARAETPAPRAPPQIIELEAMVIEGKVAKPQVFYVLGRSRVQYENLKMHRVFVDRIVSGAKKNPF